MPGCPRCCCCGGRVVAVSRGSALASLGMASEWPWAAPDVLAALSAWLRRALAATASVSAAAAAGGELEKIGREGGLEGASMAYEALETALQELKPALARLTEVVPSVPCVSS